MILIIDNYDSFTYNLVQAMGALGADPCVRRNDQIGVDEIAQLDPDGIVLSPGPCTPSEAGVSIEVVQALSGHIPILGVCLGHQCIARAFGGVVQTRQPVMHGKTSRITHDGSGLFAGLPDPLEVARYHSLVVPEPIPDSLVITATTVEDGVVMAFRHRHHPTYGVQFHPESYMTPLGPKLLQNFLRSIPCSRTTLTG